MNEFISLCVFALVALLFLILRLNMPKIKGSIGESIVAKQLAKLSSDDYKVLNDVLIVKGNQGSQIDHIVVSRFGVFVIETKHFKGWIHGHEHSEYWTQSIYHRKHQFLNPTKQNAGHIRTLKNAFPEYPQAVYYSIVVFTGSGELKNVYTSTPVIYDYQLRSTIFDLGQTVCLSIEEVEGIFHNLRVLNCGQEKKARKEHILRTRSLIDNHRQQAQSLICPKCGAELVARHGPYGQFLGCQNYPGCKFILK